MRVFFSLLFTKLYDHHYQTLSIFDQLKSTRAHNHASTLRRAIRFVFSKFSYY